MQSRVEKRPGKQIAIVAIECFDSDTRLLADAMLDRGDVVICTLRQQLPAAPICSQEHELRELHILAPAELQFRRRTQLHVYRGVRRSNGRVNKFMFVPPD